MSSNFFILGLSYIPHLPEWGVSSKGLMSFIYFLALFILGLQGWEERLKISDRAHIGMVLF